MRSKYILGVLGAGFVMALAAGCGSDAEDDNTGGSGGAGAAGSSSSTGVGATTSSSGSGMPTSSSSSGTPDTNVDCATGVPIEIDGDGLTEDELENPETDEDFFTFTGTAGQALFLFIDAKPQSDEFADGYVDSVLTLYGPDRQQYAENDDPIPRNSQDSELYTVLPEDGTYCIKVQDFCKYAADKGEPCPATAAPVTDGAFGVYVAALDPTAESVVEHDEATDPAGTPMEYLKNPNSALGAYYLTAAYGDFASDTDEDVFIVDLPEDLPCDAAGTLCSSTVEAGVQRVNANIDVFPVGSAGNGSSAPTGILYLTTVAAPTARIAELDATKLDPVFGLTMTVPVDTTQQYLLHVQSDSGTPIGANPFYVLVHNGSGSNPLEQETTNENDTVPEPLEGVDLTTGYTGYFIAGDLSTADDVDKFSFQNASMNATDVLRVICSSWRSGSGVRGLNFTVTDSNGVLINGGTSVKETDTLEATLGAESQGIQIPMGVTDLVVNIQADSQDAGVSGAFYQCGVSFGEPSP